MKHQCRAKIVVGALAIILMATCTRVAPAAENSQANSVKKILSKVPPPELPAKAAELVGQAEDKEQKVITVTVVRVAVERNSVAAPFIVSAVAKAVPAMAPVAAATAAKLQPKQAGPIAKAAAAAAPAHAAAIVFAICKELPGEYVIVAIGASEGAPAATREILEAVSRAVPVLKPFVEEASKAPLTQDGYVSAMVGIMQHVETLAVAASVNPVATVAGSPRVAPPPPGGGGPFTPGTQGNGDPQRKHVQIVQPGIGRVYSGP